VEVISAQHIIKHYPTGHGIQNISFSVEKGQCFGILGENGSGKSTLARLIAGIDRIQQGQLTVFGQSAFPRPPSLRRRCGVALDTPSHWETLTGRQNLAFFARQYGLKGSALNVRIDKLLSEANLKLHADHPVSTYSFGMRRKLNIIEAFAHTPDLLILDEPSAGLDMVFLDRMAQWILQRSSSGLTTWIADNNADWLARTATNVILLSQGRIAAAGDVKELMNSIDAQYRITIELERKVAFAVPALPGVFSFQRDGKQVIAEVNSDPHLPSRLLGWICDAGGQVRSMEIRSITLYEALRQCARESEVAV